MLTADHPVLLLVLLTAYKCNGRCSNEQASKCKEAVTSDKLERLLSGGKCMPKLYAKYFTHWCSVNDYANDVDHCCCLYSSKVLCCSYHQDFNHFRCSQEDDTVYYLSDLSDTSQILAVAIPAVVVALIIVITICCYGIRRRRRKQLEMQREEMEREALNKCANDTTRCNNDSRLVQRDHSTGTQCTSLSAQSSVGSPQCGTSFTLGDRDMSSSPSPPNYQIHDDVFLPEADRSRDISHSVSDQSACRLCVSCSHEPPPNYEESRRHRLLTTSS